MAKEKRLAFDYMKCLAGIKDLFVLIYDQQTVLLGFVRVSVVFCVSLVGRSKPRIFSKSLGLCSNLGECCWCGEVFPSTERGKWRRAFR